MIHRRIAEHLREAVKLTPAEPALAAGLRAAVATLGPAVAASALGLPGGLWMSVGGFNASLADKGGAHRARMRAMAATAAAGALGAVVGGLAGLAPLPAKLLLTFAWVAICAYARVYGAAAAGAGTSATIVFVIASAIPAHSALDAAGRALPLLGGSLWAMLLSLVLWPIHLYRPARRAVASCARVLSGYASTLAALARDGGVLGYDASRGQHGRMRESLEAARSVLTDIGRGRGERVRGENLVVVLEGLDAVFSELLALKDDLEGLGDEPSIAASRERLEAGLGSLSGALVGLARLVEDESSRASVRSGDRASASARGGRPSLSPVEVDGALAEGLVGQRLAHAERLLARARKLAEALVETASELEVDRGESPAAEAEPSGEPASRSWLAPLRDGWSLSSLSLRHALRVGLTMAAVVAATSALPSAHGYWVTITVFAVMMPHTGSTFLKALQRVLGTAAGCLLLVAVTHAVREPSALLAVVFFTAALAVALLPLNYGLFTAFSTITFVALAELSTGAWDLAHVRVENTLLGGLVALLATRLLWEKPERALFPGQMAAALRAGASLLRAASLASLGDEGARRSLASQRRALGLALLDAEASFQRLLSEPRRRGPSLEAQMALLAFTRRIGSGSVALAASHAPSLSAEARAAAERLASQIAASLDQLADAVEAGHEPPPLPDGIDQLEQAEAGPARRLSAEAPLLWGKLERVARQLSVARASSLRTA